MKAKRLFGITIMAVSIYVAMLLGFLGMCGVNTHIYSLIATALMIVNVTVIYKKVDKHEMAKHENESSQKQEL